jgi:hypothetical protein
MVSSFEVQFKINVDVEVSDAEWQEQKRCYDSIESYAINKAWRIKNDDEYNDVSIA